MAKSQGILKASWESAALMGDQLPLTFWESCLAILFIFGQLRENRIGGSGQDLALSLESLLFSDVVSLAPVGTVLKEQMAKGSFLNVFKEMGNVGDWS